MSDMDKSRALLLNNRGHIVLFGKDELILGYAHYCEIHIIASLI